MGQTRERVWRKWGRRLSRGMGLGLWLTGWLGVCFGIWIGLSLGLDLGVEAAELAHPHDNPHDNGAVLFDLHCSGCHPGGGNIIRRGKTLKLKALQRYQVDSLETMIPLITQGKGIMSAFGDRLSPEDIKTVAQYVLDQADQGWH